MNANVQLILRACVYLGQERVSLTAGMEYGM